MVSKLRAQIEWDNEQARLADSSAQTFDSVFDVLERLIEHTKQAGAARQALFWPGLQAARQLIVALGEAPHRKVRGHIIGHARNTM